MFENYAYIIDIKKNNAMLLGYKYFTPLEVILRKGSDPEVGEKVFIGKEKRDEVYSIRRKLTPKDLEKIDEDDFKEAIKKIILENKELYVDFLNNAKPLNIQRHQLQLLPKIGEKKFKIILEERKKTPFKDLDDFEDRTEVNIIESLIERIYSELLDKEKHKLFIRK